MDSCKVASSMNSAFCSTWCCGLIRAIAHPESSLLVTLCHTYPMQLYRNPPTLLLADVRVASSSRLRIKPDRNIWTCLWGHVSSHFCWVELLGLSREGCLDTPWRSLKMEKCQEGHSVPWAETDPGRWASAPWRHSLGAPPTGLPHHSVPGDTTVSV